MANQSAFYVAWLTTRLPEGFTPFLARPFFAIRHCETLTNNYMHSIEIKFTSFFSPQIEISCGSNFAAIFYYINKTRPNILKTKDVFIFGYKKCPKKSNFSMNLGQSIFC